ncbi:MAG: LacI family DNA-binding transcriptional regulator [Spirochaetes bacterium]|nr:LacI family DNA-binding transcriptional regulator [Spirochaetota bacterium]
MITIIELAKILNLAPSTVSMALNDRKGISPDVRIKVKEAARKYGYMPYMKARESGMYKTDPRVISIIFPKCDVHITETIQSGIDKVIKENDYHKIRYTIDMYDDLRSEKSKEMFLTNILEHTSTNGILLFSLSLTEITLAKLVKKGVYIVFLNTFLDYGKCVYMDNISASFKAVKKLIEMGRKNIGLVIPDSSMGLEWKDRFLGYKKALKEKRLKFNPEYVIYENDFSNLRNIAYATKNLIEQNPQIDAMFYASDIFAFAGIKVLKDMGKKIPDDIALIGIDDMPIDEVLDPSLSSVKLPLAQMGEIGAKMLLQTIVNKQYDPESVLIEESEVILRASCAGEAESENWV